MQLRIKEIIKEKGLYVKDVADKMGIMSEALSRIINGKNTTLETLERIANALDVPITDLFSVSEKSDIAGYIEQGGNIKKISSVSDLEEILEKAKSKEL